MSDLKNNLFYYATKELSQDAFICWLSSFALNDADTSDGELVQCGKDLIYEFMNRGIGENIDRDRIQLTSVEKQVGNIDVLLTVNYGGKTYKIIVEDKVHSSEHDNQLNRYKENLQDKSVIIIGIYFKTGFQSNLSEVNKAGYKVFNRQDVLALLKKCGSNNAILRNYREYWENFEELTQSYRANPLEKWPDWQAVNGFYEELQSVLETKGLWAGYGYVPNPSGGFWGLWYGVDDDHIVKTDFKAALYLQVEMKWIDELKHYDFKICLKLEMQTGADDEKYRLRDFVLNTQDNYGFIRPDRLRFGKQTATVGVIKGDFDSYSSDKLKEEIISSVDKYKKLLEYTQNNYAEQS